MLEITVLLIAHYYFIINIDSKNCFYCLSVIVCALRHQKQRPPICLDRFIEGQCGKIMNSTFYDLEKKKIVQWEGLTHFQHYWNFSPEMLFNEQEVILINY